MFLTLREFGYYVYQIEGYTQEQALVYNPDNPAEWWNTHFSSGPDSQFVCDYAKDVAVNLCIADEIFYEEAKKQGLELNEDGDEKVKTDTQEMINKADLDIRKKLADSQISVNDETMNQIKANIAQIAQTTENLKVENAIASLQLQWDRASFDDRVKLVQAQWKAANAQANLSNAQAHRITTLLNQELSNLQAEFSSIVASTNLTEQQKSNMAQQKIIDAADNFYLKVATDAHNNGNEFKAFGAELVHMFTHLFKFGKNF